MRIGVTGNYASGKGTVCGFFESLGAVTIDTDIIAREIVEPGSEALGSIVRVFGNEYLNPDGSLNRKKLGSFVFEDIKRVRVLNGLLHPKILEITISRSSETANIYMINAPVLFEAGFDKYMDKTIVVTASHDQSVARGIIRDGLDVVEIEKRISRQFSLNEKIRFADYVIDNSKDLDFTRKQVFEIWNNLINRNQDH